MKKHVRTIIILGAIVFSIFLVKYIIEHRTGYGAVDYENEDLPAGFLYESGEIPSSYLIDEEYKEIYREGPMFYDDFYCLRSGQKADLVRYYEVSLGYGITGGWYSRYAAVCGDEYLIVDRADHFGENIYGLFSLLEEPTETPVTELPNKKMSAIENFTTLENSLYSLQYPSAWEVKEEQQGTGGPASGVRTDIYNFSVDSPVCPAEMIHITFDTAYWYDTEFLTGPSFEEMVKSDAMYAGMKPEMGKWSGELIETTIGGKEAFQVDSLGWEVGCESNDYIVNTGEGHYMTIEISAGEAAINAELVDQVLDSLVFKQ